MENLIEIPFNCVDRFWEKVNKNGNQMPHVPKIGKCWEWIAGINGNGRPIFSIRKKSIAAHRVSYILHFGDIPKDICVLHRCDNPICVRPDHLFLGTHLDNANDRDSKGRGNVPNGENHYLKKHPEKIKYGENTSQAKLTENEILQIRKMIDSKIKQKVIAKKFGICRPLVSLIKHGHVWSHLEKNPSA